LEWRTYRRNYSFEAQINTSSWTGQVSQSFQIAPFDYKYQFNEDGITIPNNAISRTNTYKGGPYQQAVSVLTDVPNNSYGGAGWVKLAFEYWGNSKDRQNSYITWYVNDVESWTTTPASIQADSTTQINARLISEEPMVSPLDIVRAVPRMTLYTLPGSVMQYIILNLGMAYNFQRQDWKHLQFPAQLMFDYVRVYQRQGQEKIGCDPSDHPTANYINK
jgi:beta-glucanase (GH16 family)